MYKIEELKGIILGINYDGVINPLEVQKLSNWLDNNRSLGLDPRYTNLIRGIEEILEDNVIDDSERELLLHYVDTYILSNDNVSDRLNELNGIVEGIVCDNVVNEEEIINLQTWLDENCSLAGIPVYENIRDLVDQIIADKIITKEEQKQFLDLISASIIDSKTNLRIDYLKKKIKKGEIIGIDLIELIDDASVINKVHRLAEAQLYKSLISYSGNLFCDTEIIFLSLVLIALTDYDSSYYDKVSSTYKDLYQKYSSQAIDNQIRSVIKRYIIKNQTNSNGRLINKVLEQTIVPQYYLPAFFEFIFDIYKRNFGFNINGLDLQDEFHFVFSGLKKHMKLDDDSLNLSVTKKSYKLIKSTKELILDDPEFTDIIKLSIFVLKLIHSNYWNDEPVNIQNPYFHYGYTTWYKHTKKESTRARNEFKNSARWTSKFTYHNEAVILNPIVFKTNKEISIKDIYVRIENDGNILYTNYTPIIESIFGGYSISVYNNIKISNPLGKLKYVIYENNKVLYSSEKKLYRDVLFFDYNNNEVLPNKNFKGDLVVIHKQPSEKVNDFVNNLHYKVGQAHVDFPSILTVDGTIYKFSAATIEGVSGDIIENTFIYQNTTKYNVYRNVNYITIQSNYPSDRLGIRINNIDHRVSEFKSTCQIRNNYFETTVSFTSFENGIYNISFFNLNNNKIIEKSNFKFAIDKEFDTELQLIDEYNYAIITNSYFFDHEEHIYHINEIPYLKQQFIFNHMMYNYQFLLDLNLYKLDDLDWRPLSVPLFKKDIKPNSKLYIYGIRSEEVNLFGITDSESGISANNFARLDAIPVMKYSDTHSCTDISVIKKYQTTYDTVYIGWLDHGDLKGITCYNHNIILKEDSYINFNPKTNTLYINIAFMGYEKMNLTVVDSNKNTVLNIVDLINGETYTFKNVKFAEQYTFQLEELSRQGLKVSKRPFKPYTKQYYSYYYIENRLLKLDNAICKNNIELSQNKLKNTYIKLSKYIGNNTYIATILIFKNGGFFTHKNFQDIHLKINVIKDKIADVTIKKDNKYLLFDTNRKMISHSMTYIDLPSINNYTLDITHYYKI